MRCRQRALSTAKTVASNFQLAIQNYIQPAVNLADWAKHTVNVTVLLSQFMNRVPEWFDRAGKTDAILAMAPGG